jgi:hypothetical protein
VGDKNAVLLSCTVTVLDAVLVSVVAAEVVWLLDTEEVGDKNAVLLSFTVTVLDAVLVSVVLNSVVVGELV